MNELIIDNFAGGGGASTGIEAAVMRSIDYAINHDPQAIAMHKANHPETYHYCEDVWDVDPRDVANGRDVLLSWFSPDCKHFSRAKGGRPVDKNIRGLAWVATRYAATVRPKLIFLENVQEFAEWGPLKDDKPDPDLKGKTFQSWINEFVKLGYSVEWKNLIACDYGAPTSRKRLFLVARRDNKSIIWPEATHGVDLLPYRSAAECIDWSIPCPSIFTRKKPLVDNTLKRIARGIQKFVIEDSDPFIIPVGYGEKEGQLPRVNSIGDPLGTIVAGGIKHRLVMPYIIKHFGGATGSHIDNPFPTITASGTQNQLAISYLTRYFGKGIGREVTRPAPTTTADGAGKTGLVTSHLIKFRGTTNMNYGQSVNDPLQTLSAGGTHFGEVRAFLIKYYRNGVGQSLQDPTHTLTTKDKFGLITIAGNQYQIVDIGMRMLTPKELFLAQGFPEGYIIDPMYNGKPLTKTTQVKMVGNSVSPHPAEALVRANLN